MMYSTKREERTKSLTVKLKLTMALLKKSLKTILFKETNMKSPYTLSVGKSTYAISFAIFFWLMVALVLTYAFCLYAAFHVIGWSALIYLTVIPITINGKPLDPWHKYISSAIWLSLIACAVYFIYTLT